LRVIDCTTRELKIVPPGNPYVALSYFWGDLSSNVEALQARLPTQVPKTIEDSMIVTLALGMRYLWIDRYSINQTDPDEKHHLIRNMDKIYRGAELTIISCAGNSPSHGLPGVCGTSRRAQTLMKIGSHTLARVESVHREIQESKWFTRGWVQALLSRRCLVFTESQMYFQCLGMTRLESLRGDPDFRKGALPTSTSNWTIDEFQAQLPEYFKRELSHSGDALNAFEGVVNHFRE
ncbi:HET-domain-containing protein, partial [Lentithecium fluviatile CBS 122367]